MTYTIYGAWSGSSSTLGENNSRYITMFEIDKYTNDKSEETDPFLLAMARHQIRRDRVSYKDVLHRPNIH